MLNIQHSIFTQWHEVGRVNKDYIYTKWSKALQKKVNALDEEASLWKVHVLLEELQKMIPALPPKRRHMAQAMVEGMTKKMAEHYENRSVVRIVYTQALSLRKSWQRYQ